MRAANPNVQPPPELHKPASGRFVFIALAMALLANLLPWSGPVVLLWPDFVALTLVYWIVHQPLRVGIGTAWFMGLLMDIADGVLFGQHALAYTIMTYAAYFLHRRIRMFSLWQQAMHVMGLLMMMQLVMLATRAIFGAAFPGTLYFVGSLVGAMLWPLLSLALQLLQRRKTGSEGAYPAAPR